MLMIKHSSAYMHPSVHSSCLVPYSVIHTRYIDVLLYQSIAVPPFSSWNIHTYILLLVGFQGIMVIRLSHKFQIGLIRNENSIGWHWIGWSGATPIPAFPVDNAGKNAKVINVAFLQCDIAYYYSPIMFMYLEDECDVNTLKINYLAKAMLCSV